MLSTLPAALAEQVSAEPDGAAGSSGHCLRVAAMAMGQERARGSGSSRAVTTGTSGHAVIAIMPPTVWPSSSQVV